MFSYSPTSSTGVMNPTTVPMNGSAGRINNIYGASMPQNIQPGFSAPYGVNQFGALPTTPFGAVAPSPFGLNNINGINNAPMFNGMSTPICNSAFCNTPFVNSFPAQPSYGYNTMPYAVAPSPFVGNTPYGFYGVPTTTVAHPMSIAGNTSVPFNAPVQNISNPLTGWNTTAPVAPFGSFVGTPSVNSFYPQSIVNNLAGISSLGLNGIAPFGVSSTGFNGASSMGLNTPFANNTSVPFGNVSPWNTPSFVNPLTVPSVGAWNSGIASPLNSINPFVGSPINSSFASPINTPWLGSSILNSFGTNPFIGGNLPQQILAQQALACSLGGCNTAPMGSSPFVGGLNTNFGFGGSPFFGGLNNSVPFGGLNNTVNPFVGGISAWNTGSVTPFNNGVCDWNCCYN